jgi:hypothetical protein
MAWKPADGERRCVHKSSRTGERCRLWGVRGTEPPTCRTHGASAPHVRVAALRRVEAQRVTELAERVEVDLPEFASAAEAARYVVERVSRRSAQFGALADQHGNDAIYRDRAGQERIRAAFTGEQKWLDSLAKVLAIAATADAARRRTSAEHEALFDRFAGAMVAAIADGCLEYRHTLPAPMIAELCEKIRGHLVARLRAAAREPAPEPDGSRYPA